MNIKIGKFTIKTEDITDFHFLEFAGGQRSIVCMAHRHDAVRLNALHIPLREYTLNYASLLDYERDYAEIVAELPADAFTLSEADVPLFHVFGAGDWRPPHGLPYDIQVHVKQYRALWWQRYEDAMEDAD